MQPVAGGWRRNVGLFVLLGLWEFVDRDVAGNCRGVVFQAFLQYYKSLKNILYILHGEQSKITKNMIDYCWSGPPMIQSNVFVTICPILDIRKQSRHCERNRKTIY